MSANLETTVAEPELEPKPPVPVQKNSSCRSLPSDLLNSEGRIGMTEKCTLQKDLRKINSLFGCQP